MSIPSLAAAASVPRPPEQSPEERLARRIIAWDRLDAAVRAMVEANSHLVAIADGPTPITADSAHALWQQREAIADAERRGRLSALSDVARMMVHLEQQVTA